MLLLILVLIIIVAYLYVKWQYTYWKRAGVYQIKPVFLLGNVKELILGKISRAEVFQNYYAEFKSHHQPHGGMYQFLAPTYMPVDLELVKNILQKDFGHFMNHGNYVNEETDPLSSNLFMLADERWKTLRAKLTPTFTTGKMKMMFPIMVSCTEGLVDILNEYEKLQEPVDIKEIIARFTTDIIGSAAFGLECNSLKNQNSEFRKYGKLLFQAGTVRPIISVAAPQWILKLIRLKIIRQEIEDFFMKVVRSTVDYREKNDIYRKDFLHLLLQLKNKGKITEDGDFKEVPDKNKSDGHFITFNELVAQCFVFFLAGFETSSSAMSFALYELAENQEMQEKLRNDIRTVLKKHDNKITYEAMMEMHYLDKVFSETLRKHPPAAMVTRVCNADYKVPSTDVTIKEGTRIIISILGIHMDPEYYPKPEVFDPERFTEENKAKLPHYAYLPFGEGPRMCIGNRFGLLQAKVGLTAILSRYKVTVNQKTQRPIKYSPTALITAVDGDVWLNLQKID